MHAHSAGQTCAPQLACLLACLLPLLQSQLSAAAPLMPPPPIKQESFNTEQHKALFREMSLGIQVGVQRY